MLKLSAFAALLLACATNASAQGVSATANAEASIVSPITITKNTDLRFGNIAAGASAGTVVLSPAGARTPSGVTLPTTTGTVTAATFTVNGTPGYTYSITLPSSPLTLNNGANTMTVNAFTSTPTPTGTLVGGTDALNVGATLNVGAAQAPGTYTSASPFTVTVNYN